MELKDIYFPVEKVESNILMPGYDFPSGISHGVVVHTPNGKKVVNFCSEVYQLLPNETLVNPFLNELSKYFQISTSVKTNGYSQFFIDFSVTDKPIKVQNDDVIFPKIRMNNSYDGKVKYSFELGFHRLVCTNGLTIPYGEVFKLKKLHTPALSEVTSYEKILDMMGSFIKSLDDISEGFFELISSKVKNVELRVEEVIEETDFPQSLMEDVLYRLNLEKGSLSLNEVNDWMVYNAFNYQLNHSEAISTKQIKRDEIDYQVLNYLINY